MLNNSVINISGQIFPKLFPKDNYSLALSLSLVAVVILSLV